MNIWSKVFVGFIFVVAICLFVAAANTLSVRTTWRERAVKLEQDIATAQAETQKYTGQAENPGKPSIHDLRAELHRLIAARGDRVWGVIPGKEAGAVDPNAAPGEPAVPATGIATFTGANIDPATGVLSLGIAPGAAGVSHGIALKGIVYMFDTRPVSEGGRYLGEFKVTAAADQQVSLLPTTALLPHEVQAVQAAVAVPANLVLTETLPIDNREIYAEARETNPELLAMLLPAATVEEFIKDGQPVTGTEPAEDVRVRVKILKSFADVSKDNPELLQALTVDAETKEKLFQPLGDGGAVIDLDVETAEQLINAKVAEEVGRVYQRELRGYAYSFRELRHQISSFQLAIASLTSQVESLTANKADADLQHAFHEAEKMSNTQELATVSAERDTIQAHREAVANRLTELEQTVDATVVENKSLAAELTAIQIEALKKVDELTSSAQAAR